MESGVKGKTISLFKTNTTKNYRVNQHVSTMCMEVERNQDNQKLEDTIIKNVRNLLFKLKKQNETIKDRLIRDIRNLLEQEEDDYYKPVRAGSFWSKN